MTIYDLHCHSSLSDGQLDLADLLRLARAEGVDVLAVTDHDCLHDLATLERSCPSGLRLIPAIELSCRWDRLALHLVGLGVDPSAPALAEGLQEQARTRRQRAVVIAERLAARGMPDILPVAERLARGMPVGRPHFARAMVELGRVPDAGKAFRRYLGAGKPGDVGHLWPDLNRVIAWIQSAGGAAVLAHPLRYRLSRARLRRLCEEFRAAGGRALEVVCGMQTPVDTAQLAGLASEFGLLASCGSDFHDPGQSWQRLGRMPALPSSVTPVWLGCELRVLESGGQV